MFTISEVPAKVSALLSAQGGGMGQGGSAHKGVGKALAEERVRAEIAVKLHMAIGGKEAHRQILEDAFHASDHDGDGSIDFDEFCSTAAAIGMGVSESELRFAFSRFDVNGDNSVDFHEVRAGVRVAPL